MTDSTEKPRRLSGERTSRVKRIKRRAWQVSPNNGFMDMPAQYAGVFYNGRTQHACNAINGPCPCGAWHHIDDWPDDVLAVLDPGGRRHEQP